MRRTHQWRGNRFLAQQPRPRRAERASILSNQALHLAVEALGHLGGVSKSPVTARQRVARARPLTNRVTAPSLGLVQLISTADLLTCCESIPSHPGGVARMRLVKPGGVWSWPAVASRDPGSRNIEVYASDEQHPSSSYMDDYHYRPLALTVANTN